MSKLAVGTRVTLYLHESKETGWDRAEALGLKEGDDLFDHVRGLGYEVKMEYEFEDGQFNLVAVDGKSVAVPRA